MPPSEDRPITVLLTEGSSLSARHTLYGLGDRYTVDLLDPKPLCQARFSRFVRRRIRCPSFSKQPREYLLFLAGLLKEQRYDVLLPTHEQVFLLSRFREPLARHVGLALPEFAALERLQSKAGFVRLLDELGLPQPEAPIIKTRAELESHRNFPFYVKLDYSTAGSGVRLVRDAAELARVADEFERAGVLDGQAETLLQQPAVGNQSTVQGVFDQGRLVAWHLFEARAIGVGGMSMARISAAHPVVIEHVRRLGERLNWHGALFIDYFWDAEREQPQYIEANPRIGETVNALLCGVNLPQALVQVSLGRSPAPQPTAPSGQKSHSGFMITMAKALAGASRRELWADWRAQRRGAGMYAESEDELTRPGVDPRSVIPAAAVTLELLFDPRRAKKIVQKTVDNYSLPQSAVQSVRELPADLLDGA